MKSVRIDKILAGVGLAIPLVFAAWIYFGLNHDDHGMMKDIVYFSMAWGVFLTLVLWAPLIHILFRLPDSIVKNELVRVGFYLVLIPISIPAFWMFYELFRLIDLLLIPIAFLLRNILFQVNNSLSKKNDLTSLEFSYWIVWYQIVVVVLLTRLLSI